jgi:Carboxypeptidase regulatory-like domain
VIGLSIATKDEDNTIMRRHIAVSRCCLFLLLTGSLLGGESSDRSGIDGFVTRDMAAAVSGATIGIDRQTGGFHRQTKTNASGYCSIDDLEPGRYSFWGEIKGYGCIIYPHVALFPGERARQDFHFVRAKRSPGSCEPTQKTAK